MNQKSASKHSIRNLFISIILLLYIIAFVWDRLSVSHDNDLRNDNRLHPIATDTDSRAVIEAMNFSDTINYKKVIKSQKKSELINERKWKTEFHQK